MAVTPIQVSRVSQSLRLSVVVESLQRTQRELFTAQARIASGRSFLSASDDPIRAARALDLTQARAKQEQFVSNLRHGTNLVSAGEDALNELNDLLVQAVSVASLNVSNLTSADEREAAAEIVASIREQVMVVANRSLLGRFIFAGRSTLNRPFREALGGVAYLGDMSELVTRAAEGFSTSISTPGNIVFGGMSASVSGGVDLTPSLAANARLEDVRVVDGGAIKKGTLVFNEAGGAGVFSADLSDADTLQDVLDIINDAATTAGASLTASLGEAGFVITPGSAPVSITDQANGVVAGSLGILTKQTQADVITGQTLIPRVTRLTPITELAGGAGIDIESGFTIKNGANSVTLDLSDAETVQDIINTINNAGVFVLARVNDAGTGIDLFNRVSGTSLTVAENGGTTAADMGLRTLDTTTPLSGLNFGRGVFRVEGKEDLRIGAKDGSTVDVNLDGAVTIGDVIDLINEAMDEAGVSVTASLAATGNGILVTDETSGDGASSVRGANLSAAAIDLGLASAVADDDGKLLGEDVNPARTNGIIDALFELDRALRTDDTRGITAAGGRLDVIRNESLRVQGLIGARSQSVHAKLAQMEDAAAATDVFLSEVEDLDFTEAVTRMQAALTQLQANMQVSSALLNISLLNFLR